MSFETDAAGASFCSVLFFVFSIFSFQWRLFLKSLRLNTMGDESFSCTLRDAEIEHH